MRVMPFELFKAVSGIFKIEFFTWAFTNITRAYKLEIN